MLCLGAHSDDIEIGVGGTILGWIAAGVKLDVCWCVLSAQGPRRQEAMAAAETILEGTASRRIELAEFRDGYFPYQGDEIKSWIENIKTFCNPDVVFTHRKEDAHQDHREISRLTWNAFRDHLVLEYEIPKWDGDLGTTQRLRGHDGRDIRAQVEAARDLLRLAALKGLVRRRYVPRPGPAARNGVSRT